MIPQTTPLRILDERTVSPELDLVSELFHRINRIIPENQHLLTISPQTTASEALALMQKHGFSQVPVVDGGEVLGVFSYRSFSKKAAAADLQEWTRQKCAPGELPVDEFLERFEFARVTDEMRQVFDAMDRDNGVLIGSPEQLQCILTPMDFLRYLYKIASPFVMLSEIELALRALIRSAVSKEELAQCITRSLSNLYKETLPSTIEEMTFDNYQTLVSHGDNWTKFESIFGGTRVRTSGKLKEICALRNDLFHFKRELTLQDHETLNDHRGWLLLKVKEADLRRRTAGE
jgi:predicted transcriptional regulator